MVPEDQQDQLPLWLQSNLAVRLHRLRLLTPVDLVRPLVPADRPDLAVQ